MALEYDLWLAADVPVAHLETLLAAADGVARGAAGLVAPGLQPITARPIEPTAGREEFVALYGFAPRRIVDFRLDKFAHDDDGLVGMATLIRLTVRLLRAIPGDAVLMFQGETPLLARRDGAVVRNAASSWSDRRLAAPDLPHQVGLLPSR